MLRAVVADLHLGQRPGDGERFRRLIAMLRERGVGEACFLGDLFRTLVGFSRFWDDGIRDGLERLAWLREGGARVVLVEGNRDFFLDAPDLGPYRDKASAVHSFAAGGRRFLLEHGDLVNRADRSYRLWRSLSKSAIARVWARLLPAPVARRIVHGTERRLSQTNFSYRRVLPVEDLEAKARRHFAAGVDVVLWGHFHRGWSMVEGRYEAHAVPAWEETGTVVWIAADGSLRSEQSRNE